MNYFLMLQVAIRGKVIFTCTVLLQTPILIGLAPLSPPQGHRPQSETTFFSYSYQHAHRRSQASWQS